MTNLLAISMPQLTGQALFSARPAAVAPEAVMSEATSLPGVTDALIPFDEILIGMHAQAHATVGLPTSGATPDSQESAGDGQLMQDQQPLLLSGIVPMPVPAVPVGVMPVVPAGFVATSEEPAPAASAPAMPVSAPTASGMARIPYVSVPELGNNVAPTRVVSNVPLATTATLHAPAMPAVSAATSAAVPAPDAALSNALQEVLSGGGERSSSWSVPQMHSAGAMPVIAAAASSATSARHVDAAGAQSLTTVLGERLQVQINQRSEHAVIRLDPPSMGSIEIVIRQEAGHLQVQLRASNGEVARQLHAIGDTLRQDLVQRQHGDVSVQVWDGSRDAADGRRQQRPAPQWHDEPGRALNEGGESQSGAAFALNE
jgi:flagellar hook-length control protein FliK